MPRVDLERVRKITEQVSNQPLGITEVGMWPPLERPAPVPVLERPFMLNYLPLRLGEYCLHGLWIGIRVFMKIRADCEPGEEFDRRSQITIHSQGLVHDEIEMGLAQCLRTDDLTEAPVVSTLVVKSVVAPGNLVPLGKYALK